MLQEMRGSMRIVAGGQEAWRGLSQYHYCSAALGPVANIYALRLPSSSRYPYLKDGLAGVIVYGYCLPNSAGRAMALPHLYPVRVDGPQLEALNRQMRCIRRVVIHPLLRGLGLSIELVRQTLPLTQVEYVECLARMGRVHPFLERAGMRAFVVHPDKPVYYLWRKE